MGGTRPDTFGEAREELHRGRGVTEGAPPMLLQQKAKPGVIIFSVTANGIHWFAFSWPGKMADSVQPLIPHLSSLLEVAEEAAPTVRLCKSRPYRLSRPPEPLVLIDARDGSSGG